MIPALLGPRACLALVGVLVVASLVTPGESAAQARTNAAPSPAPAAMGAAAASAPDSLTRLLREPGGLQRVLSHGDSVVKSRGGARADDAQLFLSWNAPWGSERASQSRTPACADPTREDTLYLSVLIGRSAERLAGFTGQLLFRATGADTLGEWWHMEGKGGANAGSLRVEWTTPEDFGWRQPFRVPGQGLLLFDRTPTAARLRMVFAVPYEGAGPVAADSIYSLCRVILRHKPEPVLAGCVKPVCVEWGEATLGLAHEGEPRVRRGERFVAFGGPYALCEPFRGPRVQAWKPKASPMSPPKTPPGR